MNIMYALYGSKKCGDMRIALSPCDSAGTRLHEFDTIIHDRFSRCRGCPYPRHGLFCWTDSETCLRTEMDEIYRRRKLDAAPV